MHYLRLYCLHLLPFTAKHSSEECTGNIQKVFFFLLLVQLQFPCCWIQKMAGVRYGCSLVLPGYRYGSPWPLLLVGYSTPSNSANASLMFKPCIITNRPIPYCINYMRPYSPCLLWCLLNLGPTNPIIRKVRDFKENLMAITACVPTASLSAADRQTLFSLDHKML